MALLLKFGSRQLQTLHFLGSDDLVLGLPNEPHEGWWVERRIFSAQTNDNID
jgi:hypothetical protein